MTYYLQQMYGWALGEWLSFATFVALTYLSSFLVFVMSMAWWAKRPARDGETPAALRAARILLIALLAGIHPILGVIVLIASLARIHAAWLWARTDEPGRADTVDPTRRPGGRPGQDRIGGGRRYREPREVLGQPGVGVPQLPDRPGVPHRLVHGRHRGGPDPGPCQGAGAAVYRTREARPTHAHHPPGNPSRQPPWSAPAPP